MDKIRELFAMRSHRLAGVIDRRNAAGKSGAGGARLIYSPLIPRVPVVEVSTATLGNSLMTAGGRSRWSGTALFATRHQGPDARPDRR